MAQEKLAAVSTTAALSAAARQAARLLRDEPICPESVDWAALSLGATLLEFAATKNNLALRTFTGRPKLTSCKTKPSKVWKQRSNPAKEHAPNGPLGHFPNKLTAKDNPRHRS